MRLATSRKRDLRSRAAGFGFRIGGRVGFGFEDLGLRLGWVVEFGDAVFPFVELDVEDADLADVTAFEAVQLGAQVVEVSFAAGERAAEDGELGAEAKELGVFRSGLAGDRGASGHGLM
jgi:hypothetical protein